MDQAKVQEIVQRSSTYMGLIGNRTPLKYRLLAYKIGTMLAKKGWRPLVGFNTRPYLVDQLIAPFREAYLDYTNTTITPIAFPPSLNSKNYQEKHPEVNWGEKFEGPHQDHSVKITFIYMLYEMPPEFIICWTDMKATIEPTNAIIMAAAKIGIPIINMRDRTWTKQLRPYYVRSDESP